MSTDPLPDRAEVVVVGAGLAGLAAARAMHRAGRQVTVLEAADGVGGRVRTDEVDGFLIDRGFQVALTAYPELRRQLDLDALDLRAFEPGALVWLSQKGHVVADPIRSPRRVLATARAPIGSPLDKARVALLRQRLRSVPPPQLLRGHDLPTITMLRSLGFSDRMIQRFFRPLFAGIQLDPTLETSRRMFDVIFRSLAGGDAAVPARGMGAIPAQLAAQLPAGSIRLSTPVSAVEGTTIRTAAGHTIEATAVVVATDGPAAAELLHLPPVGGRAVGSVWFAADRAPVAERLVVLDGTGAGPVMNVAVMTNVTPTYAPAGQHLIVAAMPGVVDGDLESLARTQLAAWWGPVVHQWRHLRTHRIAHGQPDQSPPLHPKQAVSLGGGVFVCGDHRDTGSIQGALHSGRRCGEAVAAWVG
jgi:phytoene dehydrogenase-like protein